MLFLQRPILSRAAIVARRTNVAGIDQDVAVGLRPIAYFNSEQLSGGMWLQLLKRCSPIPCLAILILEAMTHRSSITLDRAMSRQLDNTDRPIAALFASCQDAATQGPERRQARQKAVCIERVARARARFTNVPIATWRSCDRRGGCSGCSKSTIIDRFMKCGDTLTSS